MGKPSKTTRKQDQRMVGPKPIDLFLKFIWSWFCTEEKKFFFLIRKHYLKKFFNDILHGNYTNDLFVGRELWNWKIFNVQNAIWTTSMSLFIGSSFWFCPRILGSRSGTNIKIFWFYIKQINHKLFKRNRWRKLRHKVWQIYKAISITIYFLQMIKAPWVVA